MGQRNTQEPLRGMKLYDFLMGSIEPDLVSSNIPLLSKKYEGEPLTQTKERIERYHRAFKTFQVKLQEMEDHMSESACSFIASLQSSIEQLSVTKERDQLLQIEENFSQPSQGT